MRVIMLAAVGSNRVIGAVGGGLPWRIPEDMAHVRRVTMGQTLVLGRTTLEEFSAPLKGREHVVVTRQRDWTPPFDGVTVTHSVPEALTAVRTSEAIIFGGGEVYAAAMPYADELLLTEVDQAPPGEAWFPEVDPDVWAETARDQRDGFAFVTYERRPEHPVKAWG
ncbi:dihydrofolate reductase [Arsenicicoccus piscis]|uniref:Dihydrofolate reductase n=1 Tax=Arsenicicoccus piscis TaxID=673954 RepID=A0ABQ6HR59_9MICO|nr:dihydrofolate reductase [Arsenicicoccus piscis]MCH8628800.1 dihydrofolate reductase [Arsenicicoccus piscis]GMA20153.1 dihydrofolate reductase [Arsenicicoccus piscis]